MIYVIDANNLAGKMGLLKEKDFDKKLIELINTWVGKKKHKVYLVFDGVDLMGDKYKSGNINVIYTTRDSHYRTADDKIIELVDEKAKTAHEEIILVTDDNEMIEAVKEDMQNKNYMKQVRLHKATNFAEKLKYFLEAGNDNDDKNLSEREVDRINNELLKIWQ